MFNLLAVIQTITLAVPFVQAGPPIDASLQHEAWQHAKVATLDWDLQGHKAAPQRTSVYIESDGKFLYVAFDAKQREKIEATQFTDEAGQGADDDVEVDLRPGGTNGFLYQFIANPIGTHYQFSSENTGYRPQWWSAGSVRDGEYIVSMRIPLAAIHGSSAGTWLLQFVRRVAATGDVDVWSYDPDEVSPTTPVYSGTMTGVQTRTGRPRPRIELYNLALLGGASIGGSTSRTGLDISIPVTSTSSLYGTVHPDYSNVELDQQSISPTAFRRTVNEVRPFFTQGNAAYGNFDSNISLGVGTLYTPAIPTPRGGFAVEGNEGGFTYGAFDAIGDTRSDSAQAVTWRNRRRTISLSAQRVAVNMLGLADDSIEIGSAFNDGKRLTGYFNYGSDQGSNVVDRRRAQHYDFGSAYSSATTSVGFAIRKEGAYFNPIDGYVWHPDTAGYGAFLSHVWLLQKSAPLRSVTFQSTLTRYHDATGELNDSGQSALVDFLTRKSIDIVLQSGSAYVRFAPHGTYYPASQSGISVTLGSGADSSNINNGTNHGASATPTTIAFNSGRFGPGRLNAWKFSSTVKANRRGLFSFELNGNLQLLDSGRRYSQWLERASYTYQAGRDASVAFGVRRITGAPPLFDGLPQFRQGSNISASYHRVFGGANEVYAVYGDAGAFATVPACIIKWIHYFGAAKGT